MDETSLQLFAKNPVARAITFNHLVANVHSNLLGLSNERLKQKLRAPMALVLGALLGTQAGPVLEMCVRQCKAFPFELLSRYERHLGRSVKT